jgi:hypothetical protein
MSVAHPTPTPFDPIAAARRTAMATTLSLVEPAPVRSAPPRDGQTELEPHWSAAIDAATD